MSTTSVESPAALDAKVKKAAEKLDEHVREIIQWHFDPDKGTPFWLEKTKELGFDPRKDVKGLAVVAPSLGLVEVRHGGGVIVEPVAGQAAPVVGLGLPQVVTQAPGEGRQPAAIWASPDR